MRVEVVLWGWPCVREMAERTLRCAVCSTQSPGLQIEALEQSRVLIEISRSGPSDGRRRRAPWPVCTRKLGRVSAYGENAVTSAAGARIFLSRRRSGASAGGAGGPMSAGVPRVAERSYDVTDRGQDENREQRILLDEVAPPTKRADKDQPRSDRPTSATLRILAFYRHLHPPPSFASPSTSTNCSSNMPEGTMKALWYSEVRTTHAFLLRLHLITIPSHCLALQVRD